MKCRRVAVRTDSRYAIRNNLTVHMSRCGKLSTASSKAGDEMGDPCFNAYTLVRGAPFDPLVA
jgi:hypothetical protein